MIENITIIIIGRILVGLGGCGFASIMVPKFSKQNNHYLTIYLVNETAPSHMRGSLGTMTQISICGGLIFVFTLGFVIPESHDELMNSNIWRVMFLIPAVLAVTQLVILFLVFKFDTPYYSLILK